MRNFSKFVRTIRQVCEPDRPCEPLGKVLRTYPDIPLTHTPFPIN